MDDLRRNLDMIDAESTFKVVSQPLRKCRFENAKTILIEPENSTWNYRTLSIFINECKTFKFDPKNGARYQFNPNGKHCYFFRFVNENDDEHFILVNISQTISVRASIKYVSNWEEENCQKSWIKKSLLMQLSSSSQALMRNSPLLYYPFSDFSHLFHSFASSFTSLKIADYSKNTMHIFDYVENYKNERINNQVNFQRFCKMSNGFCLLKIAEHNNTTKKFNKIEYNSNRYYILGGVFINIYAKYIVLDSKRSGLMLDTTWKLLQHYVVSIPTVIIHNVGVPLGFSFGIIEDSDIYNNFFEHFKNVFGFQIPTFINVAESDQGSGLKKAIKDQGLKHLCCLRHLLVSLGRKPYSQQVGNLVSTASSHDLEELKKVYNKQWKKITDTNLLDKLERKLNKVGLSFKEKKKISIEDQDRWEEVSMVHRASFKMPSCTNQLESTHGHLNAQLPRNNSFWPGMQRIADYIMKKIHNYELFYEQNYSRYKRKVKNTCNNTPLNIMQNMIRSYKTDITSETCLCGESVLISSMLQIKLPCSHLYFLGMQFPKFDVPKLEIEYVTNGEVFVEYEIVKSQKVETNCDYYDKIRLYTLKIIKF